VNVSTMRRGEFVESKGTDNGGGGKRKKYRTPEVRLSGRAGHRPLRKE